MFVKIGKCFRVSERYKNDKNFRDKHNLCAKLSRLKHKEKYRERQKQYVKELNDVANKHCVICNKLLHYRTKSSRCRKHYKTNEKIP